MKQNIPDFEFKDEDDKDNFIAFKKSISFLDEKWPIEDKYQTIIDNLDNSSITKLFFGNYTDMYILEVKKRLPILSDNLDNLPKKKKIPNEMFRSFQRLRYQTETLVLKEFNKIKKIDSKITSNIQKDFKSYVKEMWTDEQDIKHFLDKIQKTFNHIKEDYNKNKGLKGYKQNLFLLTYALVDEGIITDNLQQNQIEAVKLFLIGVKANKNDISGYNKIKLSHPNISNYKKIKSDLLDIINNDLQLKVNRRNII